MSRVSLPFLLIGLQACAALPGSRHPRGAASPPPAVANASQPVVEETTPADGPLGPADDESDEPQVAPAPAAEPAPPPPPHPLAGLSNEQLEQKLVNDPDSLGSVSLGRTNAGALFNGVQMQPGPYWNVVNPRQTWGTKETVEAIEHCIDRLNEEFPDTQPLYVGDISERHGGHIAPHISHQAGRDVNLGYYYSVPNQWYVRADGSNLDTPRTWAFVKILVTEADIEHIFMDRKIQKLLKDYALAQGEDPTWLDRLFGGPLTHERPLIMHEDGHDTHMHVRFYNRVAQESGRRLYRMMIAHHMIQPPTYYVHYKVKRGDNLGRIARRYHVEVKAIKRANGLRSSRIIAGRSYKIPQRGGVTAPKTAVVIPPRRLPPRQVQAKVGSSADNTTAAASPEP